jgi:cytochrome c oxidase subunit IV
MAAAALAQGGGGPSSSNIGKGGAGGRSNSWWCCRYVVDRFSRYRQNSLGSYGGQGWVWSWFVMMMNAPLLVAHISVMVFRVEHLVLALLLPSLLILQLTGNSQFHHVYLFVIQQAESKMSCFRCCNIQFTRRPWEQWSSETLLVRKKIDAGLALGKAQHRHFLTDNLKAYSLQYSTTSPSVLTSLTCPITCLPPLISPRQRVSPQAACSCFVHQLVDP